MIYLVLDTNIWLYLANGYDREQFDKNLHFDFLKTLEEPDERKEICILVNDIIISEWNRHKRKIGGVNIRHLERELEKNELSSLTNQELKKRILENKQHLNRVDEFIHKKCKKIEINDTVKLKVF